MCFYFVKHFLPVVFQKAYKGRYRYRWGYTASPRTPDSSPPIEHLLNQFLIAGIMAGVICVLTISEAPC